MSETSIDITALFESEEAAEQAKVMLEALLERHDSDFVAASETLSGEPSVEDETFSVEGLSRAENLVRIELLASGRGQIPRRAGAALISELGACLLRTAAVFEGHRAVFRSRDGVTAERSPHTFDRDWNRLAPRSAQIPSANTLPEAEARPPAEPQVPAKARPPAEPQVPAEASEKEDRPSPSRGSNKPQRSPKKRLETLEACLLKDNAGQFARLVSQGEADGLDARQLVRSAEAYLSTHYLREIALSALQAHGLWSPSSGAVNEAQLVELDQPSLPQARGKVELEAVIEDALEGEGEHGVWVALRLRTDAGERFFYRGSAKPFVQAARAFLSTEPSGEMRLRCTGTLERSRLGGKSVTLIKRPSNVQR